MAFSAYRKYRPTDCDWLPSIPFHWALKPLKFVATCNDEALPETTDPDYEFDYIDISSVSLIEGVKHREHLTFEKAPSRARRIVKRGDSLVSTVRTYLKAVATIDENAQDLIVSTGFAVLRPGPELHPKFLGYYVQTHGFVDTVVARSTGVSYPAILATELVTIPAPIPTLMEQAAISEFLDRETARIDALIGKKRRLLELLEEKRLAVITHAVAKGLDPNARMKDSGIDWLGQLPAHWEAKRLKYVSPKVTVGIVVTPAAYYVEAGVTALRGFNIKERSIDLSDLAFISEEANELHAKSKIFEGTRRCADRSTRYNGGRPQGARWSQLRRSHHHPSLAGHFARVRCILRQFRPGQGAVRVGVRGRPAAAFQHRYSEESARADPAAIRAESDCGPLDR
jgi:type I restriction enzyme S subunit